MKKAGTATAWGNPAAPFPPGPTSAPNGSKTAAYSAVRESIPPISYTSPRRSRPFMSQTDFPHPVQITIPNERLAAEYLNVTVDRCPDRNWQFTTNLHRTMRIAPGGEVAPTVAEPFQTLALLQRPEPIADFEIYGLHMPAEIDP